MTKSIIPGALAMALLAAWPHAQQPPQPPVPQQPTEIATTISGEGGAAPRLAVPDFIALSTDAETVATAKTIGQVLWDDLNFEREFAFIPRDVYSSIPKATSFADVPFDRWRELNADGLIVGTVQKVSAGFKVEMRLFNVRTRQSAFAREYGGSNPRLFAHTMSDELHKSQRALNGVARTKLTFDSDRDGERMSGTVQNRSIKEIYISDYDGENQKRVTVGKTLNIAPRWSPDARSIAYTSYRRGGANIFISNIFQGTLDEVTKGDKVGENWLPAWSPDGTKLAFSSTRDGNPEIYVVNRDGSGLRRLTNNPSIDITPTWSPSGTQIAFTSDRSGTPQIYVVGADGLNLSKKTSGVVLRPPDLVAGAVQRDRVRVAQRPRVRHPGARPLDRRHQVADLRRRHERKPGVLPQRPPHRVHVHAIGQGAGVHDGARREERAADYQDRQQRKTGLVQMTGESTMKAARSIATLVAVGGAHHRGRLRQEDPAGRAACAAAAIDDRPTAPRRRGRRRRRSRCANRSRSRPSRCATMRFRRRRSTT